MLSSIDGHCVKRIKNTKLIRVIFELVRDQMVIKRKLNCDNYDKIISVQGKRFKRFNVDSNTMCEQSLKPTFSTFKKLNDVRQDSFECFGVVGESSTT